jgi:hypothetical protein
MRATSPAHCLFDFVPEYLLRSTSNEAPYVVISILPLLFTLGPKFLPPKHAVLEHPLQTWGAALAHQHTREKY